MCGFTLVMVVTAGRVSATCMRCPQPVMLSLCDSPQSLTIQVKYISSNLKAQLISPCIMISYLFFSQSTPTSLSLSVSLFFPVVLFLVSVQKYDYVFDVFAHTLYMYTYLAQKNVLSIHIHPETQSLVFLVRMQRLIISKTQWKTRL